MSDEMIFASGLYVKRPERAPDFVIAHIGVDVEQFTEWLIQQEITKGFVNLQMCLSRGGKLYCHVVKRPPTQTPAPVPTRAQPPLTERPTSIIEDFNDELPF